MDTDKDPLPPTTNRTARRDYRKGSFIPYLLQAAKLQEGKKLQRRLEDLERRHESPSVASPELAVEFQPNDPKEVSDREDTGYHEALEGMSTMANAPTKLISSQCRECLDLFQRLRSLLEELDEDMSSEYQKDESLKVLQEAFLQFQAWSTNIGALHSEYLQSSLDYRLREAKNIRVRIMKVLRHLAKSLDDASSMISEKRVNRSDSSSESDFDSGKSETSVNITHTPKRTEKTELQGLLSTAQGSASNLMKLSMIIRNSPARDDYPKAAAQYQFDPRYDINYVMEKHEKSKFSKTWLLERLGKAITLRRQYLMYRKEHHGKLTRDWDEVVLQTKGKDNVTVAKSAALTKATTFYEESPEYSKEVSFSPAGSQTSYDPTEFGGPDSSKLAVPAHPIMAFDDIAFEYGKPFLCPYCYTEQQVKDRNAWKRHVFRDLKPYVCTFEECGLRMFSSRHEWFGHEMKVHQREWTCPYCKYMPYYSKSSFKRHLNNSHFISDASQIEALLLKCSEPLDRVSANACYLCDDWEKSLVGSDPDSADSPKSFEEPYLRFGTTRRFQKHLGQHMEQLALFALPSFQNEDECTDSSDQEDEIQEEGSENLNYMQENIDDALKGFASSEPRSPTQAMATEDIPERREAPEQKLNVEKATTEVNELAAQAAKEGAAADAKSELDKVKAEIESKMVPREEGVKKPIKFKDAVGRKFSFPFHLCQTWAGMEELIRQAFLPIEFIGPHVQDGHYDLIGPNGEIILPQVWETIVEPGWSITMQMWPMPEPKPPLLPPPPPGYGSDEPEPNTILMGNDNGSSRPQSNSRKKSSRKKKLKTPSGRK